MMVDYVIPSDSVHLANYVYVGVSKDSWNWNLSPYRPLIKPWPSMLNFYTFE